MLDLVEGQPIFVGFKLDTSMKRQIEALSGPDKKYISSDNSDFLRLCRLGDDLYVGKVIHERLTTPRVDDLRRNVLSIMRRLLPEVRFPEEFTILACAVRDTSDDGQEKSPPVRVW